MRRPLAVPVFALAVACSDPGAPAGAASAANGSSGPKAVSATAALSSAPSATASSAPSASPSPSASTGIGLSGWGGEQPPPPLKRPPSVRMGSTSVVGRLPPEVIQRIVRRNFGRYRLCYENALKADPKVTGRVTVTFQIQTDGASKDAKATSDITDATMVECVRKGFEDLSFPAPEGGVVKVTYPILFAPPEFLFSVNGKHVGEVTVADVKKAVEDAGFSVDETWKPPGRTWVTVFTVKRDKLAFKLWFDPSGELIGPEGDFGNIGQQQSAELARLTKDGVVARDGRLVIALEGGDKAEMQKLLDAIAKPEKKE